MTDQRKMHYAVKIYRSVRHLGETVWQPMCLQSDTNSIRMTTELPEVSCLRCRDQLIRHARKLGISKEINRIRREGVWYTP